MATQSFSGLGYLPVGLAVFGALTVITTYILAVTHGDVYPFLPTISATGEIEPERNIFTLCVGIATFLGVVVVTVRYKQYQYMLKHVELEKHRLKRINKLGFAMGVTAFFGLAVVASFQVSEKCQIFSYNNHEIST